jgi:hypothetical protein
MRLLSLATKCGQRRPAVGEITTRSPPAAGTQTNCAPSIGVKPPNASCMSRAAARMATTRRPSGDQAG